MTPANTSPRSERGWLIALALIMLLAVGARLLPTPRTIDDAFITFRYARNLARGDGFVYNPGVQTLGTTTPLFTLAMTTASLVTGGGQAFPWYALVLSAAADAANAVLLARLGRRATGHPLPGIVLGALWAVSPPSVTFAVGGMETSVNILFMLAAFTAYLERKPVWVGVFAGLGLLTRIDAALWIAPLGVAVLVEAVRGARWGALARTAVAGLITVAPWFVFSTVYFGSPLPNSLSAKAVAYRVGPGSALVTLVQQYSQPFSEFTTFGGTGALTGAVVYTLLNVVALTWAWRRAPRLLPLLLYPWLYITVFALANPLIFRWYLLPPMPGWMLGIAVGAWALLAPLGRSRRALPAALFTVPALLWAFTSLNAWMLTPDHGPNRPAPYMAWHEIELNYRDMAQTLVNDYGVGRDTRVASADIGAVGYFTDATIVDTVGLVTPELSAYYPFDAALLAEGQNYAIPPQLIADTDPAYLVTMEGFVRQGLAREPFFTEAFTLAREIPMEVYGSGMQLWVRR